MSRSRGLPLSRDLSGVQVLLRVGTFASCCCQHVFVAAVGGGSRLQVTGCLVSKRFLRKGVCILLKNKVKHEQLLLK